MATPLGLLQFRYMPFGLKTASQTFQRCLDVILRPCRDFVFNFIDDIIVHSPDMQTHLVHLAKVFELLNTYGLTINVAKSKFALPEVDFLGFHVSASGISPSRERSEALLRLPEPKTFLQMSKFVHTANVLSRFIPHFGRLAAPLHKLKARSNKPENETLVLTKEQHDAFHQILANLANSVELRHPIPNARMVLEVDASDTGYGCVLYQVCPETAEFEPIYSYSQAFSSSAKTATADIFAKELEGLYQSIKRLRRYIVGHQLTVYSDNQNLVHNLLKPRDKSDFLTRRLMLISEYVDSVYYIESKANMVADYLSRFGRVNALYYKSKIDYAKVFNEQLGDQWCASLEESPYFHKKSDWHNGILYRFWVHVDDHNRTRICVPLTCREMVYNARHSDLHRGAKATCNDLAALFYWPDMKQFVRDRVQSCRKCQEFREERPVQNPVKVIEQPDTRFHTIHLDCIGPMVDSNGYKHALTIIDRHTGYLVIHPLKAETYVETFNALQAAWFKYYGYPSAIITDQGSNFVNQFMQQLTSYLGIRHIIAAAGHPQTNGFLERRHRDLKHSIRCLDPNNWAHAIPLLQLALNNVQMSDKKYTPAQMVVGTGQKLPSDFFSDTNCSMAEWSEETTQKFIRAMNELRPARIEHHSTRKLFTKADLALARRVWLSIEPKTKLDAPHHGPYEVIARKDDYYTIDVDGKQKRYNVDRLKPHYELNHIIFGGHSLGTIELDRHNRRAPRKQTFQDLLQEYNPNEPV